MKQLICSAALITVLFGSWQAAYAEEPIGSDPAVVIKESKKGKGITVETFRLKSGFVYAYKVTPKGGTPYYLVAADNEGNFIRTDKPHQMLVPSWKIFEW